MLMLILVKDSMYSHKFGTDWQLNPELQARPKLWFRSLWWKSLMFPWAIQPTIKYIKRKLGHLTKTEPNFRCKPTIFLWLFYCFVLTQAELPSLPYQLRELAMHSRCGNHSHPWRQQGINANPGRFLWKGLERHIYGVRSTLPWTK